MADTASPEALFERLQGPPPSSRTLGWELISLDAEEKTARVRFDGKAAFTNPAGTVQGGFLAAMLDDAIGMLSTVVLKGTAFPSTIDLSLHYHRPVRPGPIEVEAVIINKGRSVIFAEANLYESRGKLAVQARSSLAIVKTPNTQNDTPKEDT